MEGLVTTEANAALLRQYADDSRAGFTAIFEAHGRVVLRYAWKLADNQADAEELAQDTFLTLWAKRRTVLAREVSLLPWLLATCKNHGGNLQRRHIKHRADALDPETPDAAPGPDAIDQLAWVEAEIAAMSPLDQAISRMCLIDGIPYRDAARELGIGYAALAKRVERTRTRLKQARADREGDTSR